MTGSIHSAVEQELKKCVERAVRPVRASRARKLALREELWAHLLTSFAAERKQQADDPAALAAVCTRFGPPCDVTAALQAAVGRWERCVFRIEQWEAFIDRVWGLHEDRSWRFFLLRTGLSLAVLHAVFAVGLLLPALALRGRLDDPVLLTFVPKIFALLFGASLALVSAVRAAALATRGAERGRRWLSIGLQAVGWTAVLSVMGLAFWWSITGERLPGAALARLVASCFGALAPLLLVIAWLVEKERQQKAVHAAWANLALEE